MDMGIDVDRRVWIGGWWMVESAIYHLPFRGSLYQAPSGIIRHQQPGLTPKRTRTFPVPSPPSETARARSK